MQDKVSDSMRRCVRAGGAAFVWNGGPYLLLLYKLSIDIGAIHFAGKVADVT